MLFLAVFIITLYLSSRRLEWWRSSRLLRQRQPRRISSARQFQHQSCRIKNFGLLLLLSELVKNYLLMTISMQAWNTVAFHCLINSPPAQHGLALLYMELSLLPPCLQWVTMTTFPIRPWPHVLEDLLSKRPRTKNMYQVPYWVILISFHSTSSRFLHSLLQFFVAYAESFGFCHSSVALCHPK